MMRCSLVKCLKSLLLLANILVLHYLFMPPWKPIHQEDIRSGDHYAGDNHDNTSNRIHSKGNITTTAGNNHGNTSKRIHSKVNITTTAGNNHVNTSSRIHSKSNITTTAGNNHGNTSSRIDRERNFTSTSPQKMRADLHHILDNSSYSRPLRGNITSLNHTLMSNASLHLNKFATPRPNQLQSKLTKRRSHRVHFVPSKPAKWKSLWDRNSTWRAPRDCPPHMDFFKNGTLARTALASMEGSGNTWVRHMLQTATGIYTGSIYKDKYLQKAGFLGEYVQDGRVTLIKTHDRSTKVHSRYERAVLLLRSPYDTFMSEINRLYADVQGDHTGHANPKIFTDGTFNFEVSFMGEKWVNFTRNWLEFKGPLALIRYEDFQTDFRSELTKLLRFLQWEVTDAQLACVEKHNEGRFHRKKKDLGFDPFTDKHKRELEEHKRVVEELISQRRKKNLPFVS